MATPFRPFRLTTCILAMVLVVTVTTSSPAGQRPKPAAVPVLTGTWYGMFFVEGTPEGFNLPVLITFHSDGTFTAVDGGDFGAIPDLPFNQASQHGVWEWLGGRHFLAKGLILSFKREEGLEGQLDHILGTRIEIELNDGFDSFMAVINQDLWVCPATFFCPDPLTSPPDLTIPAEEADFWLEGRRLK